MQVSRFPLYVLTFACIAAAAVAAPNTQEVAHMPFPETYRSWQLVKSIVVGPDSPLFEKRGGIHHYYANSLAMVGYRTGKFPKGAIIVDEAMWMKDGDGRAKGIWLENGVRFLEAMNKDAGLYKTADGWAFERFEGESHDGQLTADDQVHCHACHENAKDHDHVFSRLRP